MKSLNKVPAKAKTKTPEIAANNPANGAVEQTDGILSTLRLDKRTNMAKQLVAIREAIAHSPTKTASGIVRDLLAVNALLMKEIVREISESDTMLMTGDGEVNPLIGKTWFQLQAGVVQSVKALMQLEAVTNPGRTPAKSSTESGPLDVSAVILEASNHD